MTKSILFNGKFLIAPPTGVHRVAAELINAIADLQAEDARQTRGLDLAIWYPAAGCPRAHTIRLSRHRVLRPASRRVWEQIVLPAAMRHQLLVSFCNVGPMLAANAITMIHDVQVHISPTSYSWIFRLWYRIVQPVLGRRNRAILTVSEFSRQAIAQVGLAPLDRIHVVPNGVDHVLGVPADRAILARMQLGSRPYVLALANVQVHKNIGTILAAFADPRLSGIDLVLFGMSSPQDFAAAGHSLPANTQFAGRVGDGEMRALMEGALLFVFPSTTEGFGLPPVEAMLLGCPTLVAPCGALPEVCGDGAIYLPPDQPGAWRDAILELNDDPALRARWAEKGRQQAAKFTWRRSALRLIEVISGLSGVDAAPLREPDKVKL